MRLFADENEGDNNINKYMYPVQMEREWSREMKSINLIFFRAQIRNYMRIFLLLLLIPGCGSDPVGKQDEGLTPDHIGKARVFYRQGNYVAAVEMYHKALEFDPDNAATYLQLGIIYDDNLKDEKQAIYYYNQFLIREPDSDKAKRVREWISKSAEMIKEGSERWEEVPEGNISGLPSESPPEIVLLPTPVELSTPISTSEKKPVMTKEVEAKRYKVKAGDTLAGIADEFYGQRTAWKLIYQANRDKMADPNALRIGQELIIPSQRNKAAIKP